MQDVDIVTRDMVTQEMKTKAGAGTCRLGTWRLRHTSAHDTLAQMRQTSADEAD